MSDTLATKRTVALVVRVACLGMAVFFGFVQILSIVHHAVKIRLGDSAEGWSIGFPVLMLFTSFGIAALIEAARRVR